MKKEEEEKTNRAGSTAPFRRTTRSSEQHGYATVFFIGLVRRTDVPSQACPQCMRAAPIWEA
jgi:hypothetical protein